MDLMRLLDHRRLPDERLDVDDLVRSLSPDLKAIAVGIMQGMTRRELAATLGVSPRTVYFKIEKIRQKALHKNTSSFVMKVGNR